MTPGELLVIVREVGFAGAFAFVVWRIEPAIRELTATLNKLQDFLGNGRVVRARRRRPPAPPVHG